MTRIVHIGVGVALLCIATAVVAGGKRIPYQACFEIAAKSHQVPLDLLLAVAATESNWDPDARSDKNAHGIMQIRWPATARHLGVRRVAELYNPCLNIDLGARYLRELLNQFHDDQPRALAAYNYGPTRIASSPELPPGAQRYAATVARHRERINRGFVPEGLGPSETRTLVTFDSRTRASRLASSLDEELIGATVSFDKREGGGYAVVLSIGSGGLTVQDRVTLNAMGWSV